MKTSVTKAETATDRQQTNKQKCALIILKIPHKFKIFEFQIKMSFVFGLWLLAVDLITVRILIIFALNKKI